MTTTKTKPKTAVPAANGIIAPSKAPNEAGARPINIRNQVGAGNPETGLAERPYVAALATYDSAMKEAKQLFGQAMQRLTAAVGMPNLNSVQLAQVHNYASICLDALEDTKKNARARVLSHCLEHGVPVGASGQSRELDLGEGFVQRVTVQKSGTDPKKFEAMLRARNVSVARYMDTALTYKLKQGTASEDLAVEEGLVTMDELKALQYEPSYRVDRIKERKQEE